jgi:hypothetical protein
MASLPASTAEHPNNKKANRTKTTPAANINLQALTPRFYHPTPDPLGAALANAARSEGDKMMEDRMMPASSEQQRSTAREVEHEGVGSLSRKESVEKGESSPAKDSPTPTHWSSRVWWARERQAPPGYALPDPWPIEPPKDAWFEWRDDFPNATPIIRNRAGDQINLWNLNADADPEQAELDRAAGVEPERLYCWLSAPEMNSRQKGDELRIYARQLWRERGYSQRTGVGAAPANAARSEGDKMMEDRMMSEASKAKSSPAKDSPTPNRRANRR